MNLLHRMATCRLFLSPRPLSFPRSLHLPSPRNPLLPFRAWKRANPSLQPTARVLRLLSACDDDIELGRPVDSALPTWLQRRSDAFQRAKIAYETAITERKDYSALIEVFCPESGRSAQGERVSV